MATDFTPEKLLAGHNYVRTSGPLKVVAQTHTGCDTKKTEAFHYARLFAAAPDLLDACRTALTHIQELRDAWMRGAIHERDGLGGTRSNRNVDVESELRAAIDAAEGKS